MKEFALKLNSFDDKPNDSDKELLKEVILKRIANLDLISNEVIDLAIEKSGGNLRQLIKLIHFAAEEASSFEEDTIGQNEIDYSIESLQRSLSSTVMMMKTFLKEILEDKMPKEDTQESLENLGKSIKMGLVFAYFNGKIWYEINPLIKDILISYTKEK